ncbi:MAG: ImmA/IrrE family metallo-endopeptidase [Acidobacteria bacterium]|nr:ImmA/IrrE family metallo-endopeptidase [Acidobacteriota bacterium]
MAIDQQELGRRLREARETCGLTQEDVAENLGVSRATVTQMELGNRSVSGLELSKLAYLYARDIQDFVAPNFAEDDVVHALFRSGTEAGGDGVKMALRDCIALGRELSNLEDLLKINRSVTTVASYPYPLPRSKWEAIQNGAQVALEERRRLGLGSAPVGDPVALLEGQGVRTGIVLMPAEVSGLMISHPKVGLFIVVNRDHAPVRQRFSWCHEYSHVLLDRDSRGLVSRVTERDDLREVRANCFAANFLMPEDGVRRFIGSLGKGATSRIHAEVFDELDVVPVDSRTDPGTQEIQLYDVVQLAYFFGVSVLSALYRLLNLKLITEPEFSRMKELDQGGTSQRLVELLALPPVEKVDHAVEFSRRFLGLALEALRRERISRSKFVELAQQVGASRENAEELIQSTGLDEEESQSVLLPED